MRIGIVGSEGNFGLRRKKLISQSEDDLKVICDIALKKNKKKSESVEWNYRNLLNYDLDLVLISTPDHFKYEMIVFFLEHDISVVVEKPLAISVEEVDEIYRIALERNLLVHTSYNLNYFPSIKKLKDLSQKKDFGKIKTINLDYGHGGYKNLKKNSNWRISKNSWGGSFIDLGSHLINLTSAFFEEEINISNMNFFKILDGNLEIDTSAILYINDSIKVNLNTSWINYRSTFSSRIIFESGVIITENLLKYEKYGYLGERISYTNSFKKGLPQYKNLIWSNSSDFNSDAVRISSSSIENEFIDEEWLDIRKIFLNKNKIIRRNKISYQKEIFTAKVLEAYKNS